MTERGTPEDSANHPALVTPPNLEPELAPADPPLIQSRTGLAATFRSLRHRNYRLYFTGQIVSLTGTWIQTTTVLWLAFDLTKQSKWPAYVSIAQIIPTFLFGTWGGFLADHMPRRSVLLVTQFAFLTVAVALAVLFATGDVLPWQLVALTACNGIVQAMDLPTRLAFVKDLVGGEDLMNAVALNSLSFNVARLLGPAVAGVVMFWWGPQACFIVNACTYGATLLALYRMDAVGFHPSLALSSGRRDVLGGFRYLIEQPQLGLLLALVAVMAMCGWPFLTLLPALAEETLGLQERAYSTMLSATGVGALLSALTVATFGSPTRQRRLVGTGVTIISASLFGLSLARHLWMALPFCALIGSGLILVLATGQSVMQLGTSDHNRGRVMAIWAMTLSGAVPLGNLMVGPAADRWGVPFVLRLQALVGAGVALILMLAWRASRPRSEMSDTGMM